MVNPEQFRRLIDDDLVKLKFLLKSKVASFEEIKREEEQLIGAIKKVMVQVKELEMVLENEISLFKKLAGGWEKAYVDKRWKAIGDAIRDELVDFQQEYQKSKALYGECVGLHERLHRLVGLLKNMHAKNKGGREEELKLLENFRQRKSEVEGL